MTGVLHLSPRAAHQLWAPFYDETPNAVLALEERVVRPMLSQTAGLHTLDLACGTGRWMQELRCRGAKTVVGLDFSREMLSQARRKDSLARSLVEADATEIPLQSHSMDFAICSFGLSYVAELPLVARELSRVLTTNGHFIVSDFHPSALARGWKRAFRHGDSVVEISSFGRPLNEIHETFIREGFSSVLCFEPEFDETEKPIFEKCGKGALFSRMLGQPVLFVTVFRRS